MLIDKKKRKMNLHGCPGFLLQRVKRCEGKNARLRRVFVESKILNITVGDFGKVTCERDPIPETFANDLYLLVLLSKSFE